MKKWFLASALIFLQFFSSLCPAAEKRMITDAAGRPVFVPRKVTHVIGSGPGALRLPELP